MRYRLEQTLTFRSPPHRSRASSYSVIIPTLTIGANISAPATHSSLSLTHAPLRPGPFDLGTGWLGLAINCTAVAWTTFVIIILALPVVIPVTAATMNYAAPIVRRALFSLLRFS